MAKWDETKHPRVPGGPGGGEFTGHDWAHKLSQQIGGYQIGSGTNDKSPVTDLNGNPLGSIEPHHSGKGYWAVPTWDQNKHEYAGPQGPYPTVEEAAQSLTTFEHTPKIRQPEPPAEGHHAMDAAGYHYQGGYGEHDDALINWMHHHTDLNAAARDQGGHDPGLDAALAKPSTKPAVLYRGGDGAVMFGDQWAAGSMVDHEWTDSGYVATSADQAVAKEYVKTYAQGSKPGRKVLMRLEVAPGVGSASIGRMPDPESFEITDVEDSGEVLLRRGLRFKVTADKKIRGVRHLTVQVQPPLGGPDVA